MQVLLPVELDDRHDVLPRPRPTLAAPVAGVDKRAEADARDWAGAVGRDVAIKVGHDAEGQVVAGGQGTAIDRRGQLWAEPSPGVGQGAVGEEGGEAPRAAAAPVADCCHDN